MYRLMLYFLLLLWVIALIFSFFGLIEIKTISVITSTLLIIFTCWLVNKILASAYKAPTNSESVYITALILSLIISPADSIQNLALPLVVSVLAISSKFILAINHKHIFNPVAFGITAGAYILNQQASWWIGTTQILPFILIGGLLVVRKIQRFDLVLSFFAGILFASFLKDIIPNKVFLDSQLIFFAFVMLTEPQTTPPKRNLRIIYGGLVGLGNFFFTPDLTLILGNIFSYLVSPKSKFLLKFEGKKEVALNTYNFSFKPDKKFNFLPGQYLEWTLDIKNPDSRGNRRYFTIASSPTEKDIHLGIKFYEPGSNFKKTLAGLKIGDTIVGSQLSGEFTLPKNPQIPLVFMAGGIGITPFRSMVKYLLEKRQTRSITLIYAAKTDQDFAYKDLFDKAQEVLGINVFYQTDKQGKIDVQLIKKNIPYLKNSIFYLSGPHGMVSTFEQLLKSMDILQNNIKVDFFPGYT